MIKIYSNGCIKCGTLKMWVESNWTEGLEVQFNTLSPEEIEPTAAAYETDSFPIVLIDDELKSFDECMEVFKENRKKQKESK